MNKEFEKRDKIIENLRNKNKDDLNALREEIYAEMENRFEHQNKIIENIQAFLRTFQDTLKIMGKDS